jgi:hypothetical protein
LTFGVIMAGAGQVWLDDVVLERVGAEVPLTGRERAQMGGDALRQRSQRTAYRVTPMQPVNLSFTQGTRTP